MSPFLVLIAGILFIIVSIVFLKIHPFIALILAAILVGLISPVPLAGDGTVPGVGQAVQAVELTAVEFGSTAAAIGIVIALAAVIGQCLMDSGAADKITRRALAVFGEKRSPLALLSSGYILAIPVFFDTVFFLLIPLARALRVRTGKNYVHYVMAIGAGGVITHSLVPPTPGPLLMVAALPGLSLGTAIGLGFLLGIGPALVAGTFFASYINRKVNIPFREVAGSSQAELQAIVDRPEGHLPGFFFSILPVLLPVALITGDTILQSFQASSELALSPGLLQASSFLGNKNVALFLGTFFAIGLLMRHKKLSLQQLQDRLEPAMLSAGIIILITSAGGAFGKMLARTGISEALQQTTGDFGGQGVFYILLAFGLASTMKIAQGSGTVAMITTSAMMAAILGQGTTLPFHIIYIFAAIAFGSLVVSWMNDSGFWVVGKMSGFTEKETLTVWTLLLAFIGICGLIEVLFLSWLFPLA
ncbi:MAG: GntP family permease [Acidobacteriota bacterium]